MAKGLRFRRIVEMLGRIPLSMVMLLGGFFEVLGADTAIQPRMLLGVYPDRPLVLKRTSCNAFDAFADGSRFVCANGTSVELWDLASGRRVLSMRHPRTVMGVSIAPDERTLLTITEGRQSPARLWSLESGKTLKEYPSPFQDDAGICRSVEERSWRFPRRVYLPEAGLGFTSVAFSPTGGLFAAGSEDGDVFVFGREDGATVARLQGNGERVVSVVFSPNGQRVLACSAGAGGRAVLLWAVEAKVLVKQHVVKNEGFWDFRYRIPLAFSADGTRFGFSGRTARPEMPSVDVSICLCDAESGDRVRDLTCTILREPAALSMSVDGCLTFLPNEQLLANTGAVLQVWDIERASVSHRHVVKSGVGSYARPNVAYVKYLPALHAAMVVEAENDENTLHQDWTVISIVPFGAFAKE